MDHEPASLPSLPMELVVSISEFLDPQSLLAIASTCDRLRRITYTPSCFKKMIYNQQATVATKQRTTLYLDTLSARCHQTASWAKYAYLEECIRKTLGTWDQRPPPRRKQNTPGRVDVGIRAENLPDYVIMSDASSRDPPPLSR